MKYLKNTYLLIILFICCIANAQNMREGFAYLENGEFAQAKVFFSAVLKEYPNNKTANLCYARALGLDGNPEKANELFSVMLKDYPNDFEIDFRLNNQDVLKPNTFDEATINLKKIF